jgi:hypothetical protein
MSLPELFIMFSLRGADFSPGKNGQAAERATIGEDFLREWRGRHWEVVAGVFAKEVGRAVCAVVGSERVNRFEATAVRNWCRAIVVAYGGGSPSAGRLIQTSFGSASGRGG